MDLRKNSESKSINELSIEEETYNEIERKCIPIQSKNRGPSLPILHRRCANDPHMMKELNRYQKIMFLTLLPSISSKPSSSINNQQHSNQQVSFQQTQLPPEEPSLAEAATSTPMQATTTKSTLKEVKNTVLDIKASLQGLQSSFTSNQFREQSRLVSGSGSRTNPNLAGLGAEPDSLLALSTNASINLPHSGGARGRRRSWTEKEGESLSTSLNKSMNVSDFNQHYVEHSNNNLDLTTLTALYLESRQKIFGEEWVKRKDKEHHISNKEVGELGSTGIVKPRRLTPLISESLPVTPLELPRPRALPERSQSLIPSATTGGLHLSARFNRSFNLEYPTMMPARKGSHKPGLRRLNSMDGFSIANTEDGQEEDSSMYRPNSAPHMPKKDIADDDTFSLFPYETPARANTPTGPNSSAQLIRPQLIGGSLATYSPDQSLSIPKKKVHADTKALPELELLRKPLIEAKHKHIPREKGRPNRKSLPSKLSPTRPHVEEDLNPKSLITLLAKPPVGRLAKPGTRIKLTPLEDLPKKHSVP